MDWIRKTALHWQHTFWYISRWSLHDYHVSPRTPRFVHMPPQDIFSTGWKFVRLRGSVQRSNGSKFHVNRAKLLNGSVLTKWPVKCLSRSKILLQVDLSWVLKSERSEFQCMRSSERRSLVFDLFRLNGFESYYKFTREKNDWHMPCRDRREISLTVLLVNCHDVTGGIFDR